jgi:hypothetical protein
MQEYALGAANNMEQEKLDNLRTWVSQIHYLKQKMNEPPPQDPNQVAAAQAAPGAGAGAPPGGPPPGMGVPAPAPVSPLLPPSGTVPAQA